MAQFYDYKNKKSYKKLDFACNKCDWSGTGEDADEDDGSPSGEGFPILCPKCREYIEWIDTTVSYDELLKYGSEKDKAHALERMEFWNNWREARLKSPEQLPDIDAEEIIITLREEEKPHTGKIDDADIVLYWKDKELWREVRLFEYYDRYISIGEILKEKYGERLIDFEAKETWALGGDSYSGLLKARKFRKSLSAKNDINNEG